MKEEVYFEKIKGKKIFCIFTEPEIKSKRVVIFSHGFKSSSTGSSRKFVILSRHLAKSGISSLRFDQFGSGNSAGDFYQSSFNDWVGTISYFSKKYINNNYKVGLLGSSMGATAVVKSTEDKIISSKVMGLALWVPDPKIDKFEIKGEYMEEGGQRVNKIFWAEAENCNFLKNLESFGNKYFIVYSGKDRHISKKSIDRVIEIAKRQGNKVFVLKNENHDNWSFGNAHKVINKTANFFVGIFKDHK